MLLPKPRPSGKGAQRPQCRARRRGVLHVRDGYTVGKALWLEASSGITVPRICHNGTVLIF